MGILSYGYKAIKSIKPTKMSKGTKLIKKEQAEVSKKISKASKETPKLKTEFKEMGNKTKSDMTKSLLKHNLREKKMGGGMMGRPMYKKGGKSFPDLTGDGKVTKKDILKGRGVPGFKDGSKGPVRKKIPNKFFGTGEGRPFPGGEKKRKEKLEKLKNK